MQEEKVEQVADIDVLPESERMMSDRMRQGRERLLWADDTMVAVRLPKGIKKTDLNPERVMEGRITDNVDIESVKAMDHWEPDSYPLEAARVLGGEEKVNMMGDNLGEGNLEAAAVKEEPKLRWGPEIEEKPEEEEGLAKSSLKLDASLAIKGGNDSSETELSVGEKTVKEEEEEQGEDEDKEQVDEKNEDEEKTEDEEKSEGEEKSKGEEKGEKEQL